MTQTDSETPQPDQQPDQQVVERDGQPVDIEDLIGEEVESDVDIDFDAFLDTNLMLDVDGEDATLGHPFEDVNGGEQA